MSFVPARVEEKCGHRDYLAWSTANIVIRRDRAWSGCVNNIDIKIIRFFSHIKQTQKPKEDNKSRDRDRKTLNRYHDKSGVRKGR